MEVNLLGSLGFFISIFEGYRDSAAMFLDFGRFMRACRSCEFSALIQWKTAPSLTLKFTVLHTFALCSHTERRVADSFCRGYQPGRGERS